MSVATNNHQINALSADFPLIAKYANKRPEHRATSPTCVKQFVDQRSGNNREAPFFMQLPSLKQNSNTYLNKFIEKSIEIEKNIHNNGQLTKTEEATKDNLKKLNMYVGRQGFSVGKSLDKALTQEKLSIEIMNISPKYLKNLNDYKISENYNVDQERQIKFEKKSSKRFNVLTDQLTEIKPGTLSVDKWSKFYENYLTLGDSGTGFKFQKGYFTDFADHQKVTLDLKKFMFMDKLQKDRDVKETTSPSPQKKVNKRYITSMSKSKQKMEETKKKTMEIIEKNNLFKLKSYLVKN